MNDKNVHSVHNETHEEKSQFTEFGPLRSELKPTNKFISWLFGKESDKSSQHEETKVSMSHVAATSEHVPIDLHKDDRYQNIQPTGGAEVEPVSFRKSASYGVLDEARQPLKQSMPEQSPTTPRANSPSLGSIQGKRTLNTVLRRLTSIIDLKGTTLQEYRVSDFQQYWMPDSSCKECYECGDKFTTFRRRHHCRVCGQIFCSRCCNQEIPGRIMGFTGDLRVCTYCCKVVLNYAQHEGTEDLQTIKENLQRHLAKNTSESEFTLSQESGIFTKNRSISRFTEEGLQERSSSPSLSEADSMGRTGGMFDVSPLAEQDDRTSELEWRILTQDSAQLKELWYQIICPDGGLEFRTHRYRLRTYSYCTSGSDIIDWLLQNDKAKDRQLSALIGQALVDGGLLECITLNEPIFKDSYMLYKPSQSSPKEEKNQHLETTVDANFEPDWFKEIEKPDDPDRWSLSEHVHSQDMNDNQSPLVKKVTGSIFYVDSKESLDSPENTFLTDKIKGKSPCGSLREYGDAMSSDCSADIQDDFLSSAIYIGNESENPVDVADGWRSSNNLRKDSGEKAALELLSRTHKQHLIQFTKQMLSSEGLSFGWTDLVVQISSKVADTVRPDVRHDGDEMDIRQYVLIKNIPGGSRSDTNVLSGVVCTKNVAHKRMAQNITNPSILLLTGPIEYQRVELKYTSLKPQILQEKEYTRNLISKLSKLKPNIIMVEKTVSRLAQQYILEADITLVLNVKRSVIERLGRFTQGDIISSIDGFVGRPRLGSCSVFQVRNYLLANGQSKTLMYFEGCATHLGCTITLRGANIQELRRLKKVIHLMTYVAYNSKLEISFLMDEFAIPPTEKDDLVTPEEEVKTVYYDNEPKDSRTQKMPNQKKEKSSVSLRQVVMTDLSDPLHDYQETQDDSIFQSNDKLITETKRHGQIFRQAMNGLVLSASPYLVYDLPFLETENGTKIPLRRFLEEEMFFSPHFTGIIVSKEWKLNDIKNTEKIGSKAVEIIPDHTFVSSSLTKPATDRQVRNLLADFRRNGGTIKPLWDYSWQSDEYRKNVLKVRDRGLVSKSSQKIKTTELENRETLDCLDPQNHQRFMVLFSSFSPPSTNYPAFCINPWIVPMEFYKHNDVTLGAFLERYCFRSTYRCPSETCETSMIDHIRRFVHGNGCLQVILRTLEAKVPGFNNKILMWSWCRRCKKVTPVVSMSQDTWSFSFAKYLELRFNGNMYGYRASGDKCPHSFHHEYHQYFGYGHMVASFKYSSIRLKEIAFPPPHITMKDEMPDIEVLTQEISEVSYKGFDFFENVQNQLSKLQGEIPYEKHHPGKLSQFIEYEISERQNFHEQIQHLVKFLESKKEDLKELKVLTDIFQVVSRKLFNLKISICQAVLDWNIRLQVLQHQKKLEKVKSQSSMKVPGSTSVGSSPVSKFYIDSAEANPVVNDDDVSCVERKEVDHENTSKMHVSATEPILCHTDNDAVKDYEAPSQGSMSHGLEFNACISGSPCDISNDCDPSNVPVGIAENPSSPFHDNVMEKSLGISPGIAAGAPVGITENPSSPFHDNVMEKSLGISPGIAAGVWLREGSQRTLSCEKTFVVCSSDDLPKTVDEDSANKEGEKELPISDKRGNEEEPKPYKRVHSANSILDSSKPPMKVGRDLDTNMKADKPAKRRWEKLASLLPSFGSSSLASPFPSDEHYKTHSLDSVANSDRIHVVVYDQEPSSIAAFALASEEYQIKLNELRENKLQHISPDLGLKSRTNSGTSMSNSKEIMDEPDFLFFASASEKVKDGVSSLHIELQFKDDFTSARFFCRVYFADEFCTLRKHIFPAGEEAYIKSLTRCVKWMAKGGKSRSNFCKTKDGRFVLKEMSSAEAQSFVDFAPNYIQYMIETCTGGRPCCLTRILGAYCIGYRNSQNNTQDKQDILVMEHLFYDRTISQIFDLKGSQRNRMASGKKGTDVVLLDEDFTKLSIEQPLYIRPHSKAILTQAINQDTHFLSKNLIMDYSMLVGIDETNSELVIGIIDYIRTFTWDKKLEMVVKKSGILGGQGKEPTILSPELYRSRFLGAMNGYFVSVPDKWFGLGKDSDI